MVSLMKAHVVVIFVRLAFAMLCCNGTVGCQVDETCVVVCFGSGRVYRPAFHCKIARSSDPCSE